jgi:hypothetical protein
MQEGSVIREHRKTGSGCLELPMVGIRSERQQSPQTNHRIILGTAEQLRDLSSARQTGCGFPL